MQISQENKNHVMIKEVRAKPLGIIEKLQEINKQIDVVLKRSSDVEVAAKTTCDSFVEVVAAEKHAEKKQECQQKMYKQEIEKIIIEI